MGSVFRRKGERRYILSYTDHTGRRRTRTSGTTFRKDAQRILDKIENQEALLREGVVEPSIERIMKERQRPLKEHIDEYLADCRRQGLDEHHVVQKETHLWTLAEQARTLGDLHSEALRENLRRYAETGVSARTLNFRRQQVMAFLKWCVREERLRENPCRSVSPVDEQGARVRRRRALSVQEVHRLIEVTRPLGRSAWYAAAYYAGLRRGDLKRLRWRDVDLERGVLTIELGKAKRTDHIPIAKPLLEELRAHRPADVIPLSPVFPREVMNRTRCKDFERAGIELLDDRGRVADLHALRSSLATHLLESGASPAVVQTLCRHRDYRTTAAHYVDVGLSSARRALDALAADTQQIPPDGVGLERSRAT